VEPALWQMEDRELTNLSRRVLLVRELKREQKVPYIRGPLLQEARG